MLKNGTVAHMAAATYIIFSFSSLLHMLLTEQKILNHRKNTHLHLRTWKKIGLNHNWYTFEKIHLRGP